MQKPARRPRVAGASAASPAMFATSVRVEPSPRGQTSIIAAPSRQATVPPPGIFAQAYGQLGLAQGQQVVDAARAFRHVRRPRAPPSRACCPRRSPARWDRGSCARASGLLNSGNDANSRRRPSRTGSSRSGPRLQKNRKGRAEAHSWPMNSIGGAGARHRITVAARSASGDASWLIRSPKARLPTWSWFWMKETNAVAGSPALGSPRISPSRKGDGSP